MEEGMKNQSRSQEGNGNQAKQRLDWSRSFLFFIFDLGWVFFIGVYLLFFWRLLCVSGFLDCLLVCILFILSSHDWLRISGCGFITYMRYANLHTAPRFPN
jgi:hypothetical protein